MILVTPPSAPVVSVADLKSYCQVDFSDHDGLLAQFEASAVGYLDGWAGLLGRAILSQVWRQEFCGWGNLRLALPDVSVVAVTYLDANNAEQPATTAVLRPTSSGFIVEADGPESDRIFVNMTCAMTLHHLQATRTVIKMLVAHWYKQREAVAEINMMKVPMAANALINGLRWQRL